MKKSMFIAIALSICCGLFLSVSASEAKQAPYVIGIALDLTGRAAGLGIPEKRVYRMRAEEFNKAGGVNGRQLKLIILDNESKPAKAVINTKKLIEVEKVIEHIKTYSEAPRGVWYPNVHYESVNKNGEVVGLSYYSEAVGEPLVLRKMNGEWRLRQ